MCSHQPLHSFKCPLRQGASGSTPASWKPNPNLCRRRDPVRSRLCISRKPQSTAGDGQEAQASNMGCSTSLLGQTPAPYYSTTSTQSCACLCGTAAMESLTFVLLLQKFPTHSLTGYTNSSCITT